MNENEVAVNLYLLYGTETYLRRVNRERLLTKLLPDGEDDTMNFTKFTGEKTEVKDIASQAETLPFFADRRVILCEDTGLFKRANDELAEFLANIPETTVLIFIEREADTRLKAFKTVQKIGVVVELKMPSDDKLATWIIRRVKDAGKQMSRAAWDEFLVRTRPNPKAKKDENADGMLKMDNEIEKLLAYCGDKDTIEKEDVEVICAGQVESKIFDMINGIAEKNKRKVMLQYHDLLLQKTPPIQILVLIERQFRRMLVVKEMYRDKIDLKTIAKEVGAADWAVRKDLQVSEKLKADKIRNLLDDAEDYERRIKSGLLDETMAVELLLTTYA